jgi:hypothetical protein
MPAYSIPLQARLDDHPSTPPPIHTTTHPHHHPQDKDGVAAASAFAEMAAEQYSQPGSPSVAQRLEGLYTK